MILKKLVLGPLSTNTYIFGSIKSQRDVVIIDPGAEANKIIEVIENLDANPIAVLLTHGHFDHSRKVKKIVRTYQIPLMYNKKEYENEIFSQKKADRWLEEGDIIEINDITLHVLETPGHSPGALSFYTSEITDYNGQTIDGIIFTGDLLFRRSIGRSDVRGGNQNQLFSSIKKKIMQNPNLTDNFVIFPGHMDVTTVGDERNYNMFKRYFT
ncbi:MAG: MBL fold metallo-hydrolase [Candidatus Lokiarchaeota archaeon]|nr:MBL fold metallo-hydrolase [Candidatus Lokiarchaeota archaeon]MBD3201995.1 MBL fold metallo-hydrolase [Candidatus Lokiarchaeota archaeon]